MKTIEIDYVTGGYHGYHAFQFRGIPQPEQCLAELRTIGVVHVDKMILTVDDVRCGQWSK